MIYIPADKSHLEEIIFMKNEVKERIIKRNLPIWLNGYPMDELLTEDIHLDYGRIVIDEGKIVAYASFYPADSDYPKDTFSKEGLYSFGRVMVRTGYEGKHYASFLVRSMIEEAKEKKLLGLGILADACNISAIRLYEKYGFKRKGSKQLSFAYLDIYEYLF